MTREDLAIGALIASCFALILTGAGMAIYTENVTWLWLCAPIVLFLS
jgi:hypothetical protein